MTNDMDWKTRVRLGEDTELELKAVFFKGKKIEPHQNSIADELAAMANTRGGAMLFGVDDKTRDVTGVPEERLDDLSIHIANACQQLIEPALPIETAKMEIEDNSSLSRPVLLVRVERSLFVHRSPGGYLYRTADRKQQMSTEYLARLAQQRSQARIIRFDEQTVPRASMESLVPALWQRFRTERTSDEDQAFLRKLALACPDEDGEWHPTVSGVLVATKDPREFIPNAFIQAVAYRGTEIRPAGADQTYQLDAKDIAGPVDEQILEACRFVERNSRIEAYKGQGRADLPQYDSAAVFEAIVNAVAHRDYSIYGSKIRLRLFADRLEIYSPGAIPNTMTVDSLAYRQAARNEALASLLAKVPVPDDIEWLKTTRKTLMDRRGEGVSIILAYSERLSGRLPEYRLLDDAELLLTIYAAGEIS